MGVWFHSSFVLICTGLVLCQIFYGGPFVQLFALQIFMVVYWVCASTSLFLAPCISLCLMGDRFLFRFVYNDLACGSKLSGVFGACLYAMPVGHPFFMFQH